MTNIQVIEAIGDTGLLLPDLIAEALQANDRIKYLLTLVQTASHHAQHPLEATIDLHGTRESSGVADASFDDVVAGSRLTTDGMMFVPAVSRIERLLFDDIRRMLEPLRAAAAIDPEWKACYEVFRQRINAQIEALPVSAGDEVAARTIDAMAAPGDEAHDTLHRIVMELHRDLNRMLADVAVETIDGARASGLTAADRALVSAFMKGLTATAPLKFDHPGLATTAARYRDRLSIQNDLGTTEGHVVVVQVTDSAATVIYSDVHHRRVEFLQDLLSRFAIDWQPGAAPAGGLEMIVGRFAAPDPGALEQFLTYFGSRLVFLIDWNRARKRLEQFVDRNAAVAILKWAADAEVGHCGFLRAGDTRLIYTAFERIAPTRIPYGARLDEVIGADAAAAFLKAVLKITARRLADGHSPRLIQDEIEAELRSHVATTARDLIDAAAEHAMVVSALAERLRRTFGRLRVGRARHDIEHTAALARHWESRADEIVRTADRRIDRTAAARALTRLLRNADDVADALEEAAFVLTLLPDETPSSVTAAVEPLAAAVSDGVREYVRCLEHVRDCTHTRAPADVDDALVAIDRIGVIERSCDAAERTARTTLVSACRDFRELHATSDLARSLEQACDALARCARILREHVLNPEGGGA